MFIKYRCWILKDLKINHEHAGSVTPLKYKPQKFVYGMLQLYYLLPVD